MEWVAAHSKEITAVTSMATLAVWIFYAQILYRNFARTRRPRIIINQGHGNDLAALCLISNMSSEPIFLEHIIATLHTNKGMMTQDMADYESDHQTSEDGEADSTTTRGSRQGPMLSGSFSHIDSFRQILYRLCRRHDIELKGDNPADDTVFHFLDIRVIAIYGSEDHPIGATRRFKLKSQGDDTFTLTPVEIDTQRYASRISRWRVRQWIRTLNNAE